jgi:hypothetical protein
MKKILSVLTLFFVSILFTFGQGIGTRPSAISPIQENESQGLEQYFSKITPKSTKAVIWSSTMSNTTDWTVTNAPDATISTQWVRIPDTSAVSAKWRQYVGPYMGSATPMNGVYYFDGITNLVNGVYGVSNSRLTTATPINTLGHPSVVIKFYQLYKSFNADSALLEISSDNVNWYTIDVNISVPVNQYAIGWKEINISPWAGNKAQVWIRFRFFGPASTSSGPQYGGGYGWMIDDVSLEDADDNKLVIDKMWIYDGYTSIPAGQSLPISYEAKVTNSGGLAQTNVKLYGKEINTNTVLGSTTGTTIPSAGVDTLSVVSFFTPSTVGNYKITGWVSSDNIVAESIGDTFNISVNNNNIFQRDNNYYYTSKGYNGEAFTVANLYQVSTPATAYSVKFAVNLATKAGSIVKGVLYKGLGQSRTLIAESDYYTLTPNDIPTATGATFPIKELAFMSPVTLDADSFYWAGLQTFGGSDTVRIACDNALIAHSGGIPQIYYSSVVFKNSDNMWYIWSWENVAAQIIRLSFAPVAVNENVLSANLFSCFPNPANKTTRISYELKNSDNISFDITDITGRIVKTINYGYQTSGNHALDVDVSDLSNGTYFYTLKTSSAQLTKKLIIAR